MSYNGQEIVEVLLDNGTWHRSTLVYWYDVYEGGLKYSSDRMRRIEGSVDGGHNWNTIYKYNLDLFGAFVILAMQWRVKV